MKIDKLLIFFSLILISNAQAQLIQFTDQQRDELIKKFAPEVRFHSDEKYFPMDVNAFLPFVNLKDSNKKEIIPKGQVTSQKLATYKDATHKDYYLGFADKSMKGGIKPDQNKLVRTRAYANFIPTTDGAIIQYLFFYPFNGPFQIGELPLKVDKAVNLFTKKTDIGEHEADWEHINVKIKGTAPDNMALVDVYYARHRPSQDGGYATPELVENTHPVVYASKWGHASHPHHKDRQSDQDATSKNGPKWQAWNDVVYIGTKEHSTQGNEWLQYAGHFGGTEHGKSSPRGPAHQPWWRTNAFQTKPSVQENPLARISAQSNAQTKKQSKEFKIEANIPTYIRKLDWYISKIHTPNIKADDITYDVVTSKGKTIFADLKGEHASTPITRDTVYIANIRTPKQESVSFDIEVRGLFD